LPPEAGPDIARPVLAFDTAGPWVEACLRWPDGRVLHRVDPMEKGQAERLIPVLQDLMAEAGLGWSDLGRMAVGTGPGNFTGVRIAVAAARGLALAAGRPALGVTRLEALAHGLPRPLTVIEDARRGEAYVQSFTATGADTARLVPLMGLAPEGWVTGSAAGPGALPAAMPLTEAMAEIAATRAVPQPRPAPFYLRGADAAPPSDPPPVILPA
jgi:tRNA threonylcarbamoyladenosine biosynthesis protein TsaB